MVDPELTTNNNIKPGQSSNRATDTKITSEEVKNKKIITKINNQKENNKNNNN